MTAADIPQTTGQPDQGFEGYRFAGYTIYDGLVNCDLSKADTIADIKPGLATEWAPVEGEPTKWIFKLRQGVKFHDGADFDADVVIWNLEKILNDKSPQFDPKQAAQSRRKFLRETAGTGRYVLPIHFPHPTAGLIEADGGERFHYKFVR